MDFQSLLTLFLVAGTYGAVAVGRWPPFRMNRATLALVGAAAVVACGSLSLEEALGALDLHTLLLLFSMMVLNANLRLSGFFGLVAAGTLRVARTPRGLLALLLASSGLLSALFLNDTVCLMLTPLVLEVTRRLGRNPVPYLVGLATSANIGSVATLTGNPQNMLIGMSGNLGYLPFAAALAPVAVLGLGMNHLALVLAHPDEFAPGPLRPVAPLEVRVYRPLLYKSLAATGLLLVLFLAGVPVSRAAFLATSVLLVTRRLKPEKVFAEFDWQLLVMFSGLFVVTAALERAGWGALLASGLSVLAGQGLAGLMVLTAVLSNLVSNVPAVLLLRPMVGGLEDPHRAWLAVAAASTLAGNVTLLGSVANLIVAEQARRRQVTVSFGAYLRVGLPLSLATLALAWAWLSAMG